ncbi:MAG: hypothetical protein ACNS62_21555 [Candidatus Cyclobacteriaceae bacterium M3_2C_046]
MWFAKDTAAFETLSRNLRWPLWANRVHTLWPGDVVCGFFVLLININGSVDG